jgi:hypothetical protein
MGNWSVRIGTYLKFKKKITHSALVLCATSKHHVIQKKGAATAVEKLIGRRWLWFQKGTAGRRGGGRWRGQWRSSWEEHVGEELVWEGEIMR